MWELETERDCKFFFFSLSFLILNSVAEPTTTPPPSLTSAFDGSRELEWGFMFDFLVP